MGRARVRGVTKPGVLVAVRTLSSIEEERERGRVAA
jgi:hypothetical protein